MRPIEMMMAEGINAKIKKQSRAIALMEKMTNFERVTKGEALEVMIYCATKEIRVTQKIIDAATRAMYAGEPKVVVAEVKTTSIVEEIGTIDGLSVFKVSNPDDKPFYNLTGYNAGYYDLEALLKMRGRNISDFIPNQKEN